MPATKVVRSTVVRSSSSTTIIRVHLEIWL